MSIDNSLTPEEVAAILRIKKNTVYELIKRGDLAAYRIGRKYRIEKNAVEAYKHQAQGGHKTARGEASPLTVQTHFDAAYAVENQLYGRQDALSGSVVICGLDIILDVMAKCLESKAGRLKVYRKNAGSFAGLNALYQLEADVAGVHLWDSDTDTYNVPYIRRLLPGIPVTVVHLATRWQGLYVQAGNPLKILDWTDLNRDEVRFINREPGCGARVLLDEKILALGLDRDHINGYHRIEHSHLAVASAVARGSADAGVGIQKAALQVRDVDFIPLQQERYELAILRDPQHARLLDAIMEILNSHEFMQEISGLGDYDLSDLGKITARL